MGVGLTALDSTPNLVPSKLNDLRQVTALESWSMVPPASEGLRGSPRGQRMCEKPLARSRCSLNGAPFLPFPPAQSRDSSSFRENQSLPSCPACTELTSERTLKAHVLYCLTLTSWCEGKAEKAYYAPI